MTRILSPRKLRVSLACFAMICCAGNINAQTNVATESQEEDTLFCHHKVQLRTNLLYWLTASPNLSLDLRVARHWSIGLNYGQNFIPLHNTLEHPHTRRLRHLLVSPEVRYWRKGTFEPKSWFFGLNPIYSHYNVSRLFGVVYPSLKDKRVQGDMYALGLFAGYTWRAGRLFRMEALAGPAVGWTKYKEYECTHCGDYIGKKEKVFVMPQLALNLVLDPHKKPEPVITPEPEPEVIVPFVPYFGYVEDNTGKAGELQKDNPILQHISNYVPYDETRILRKESDALYVYFPLDSITLFRDFRDNAPILDRIMNISELIMKDSISTVKKIQIIGMASVEGTVKHNCWLAENRAEALKDYVQRNLSVPTPDSLYELNYSCEGWTEFRDQVNDIRILKEGGTVDVKGDTPTAATLAALTPEVLEGITLKETEALLKIIDTEAEPQRREWLIKQYNGGKTYQFLLKNVLADQRNSGYMRIYYDYVPDEAARAINRAIDLMKEKRYTEALALLEPYKNDTRAWNPLGLCYYVTDRQDLGLQYLRRSMATGNADAKKNLDQINSGAKVVNN